MPTANVKTYRSQPEQRWWQKGPFKGLRPGPIYFAIMIVVIAAVIKMCSG